MSSCTPSSILLPITPSPSASPTPSCEGSLPRSSSQTASTGKPLSQRTSQRASTVISTKSTNFQKVLDYIRTQLQKAFNTSIKDLFPEKERPSKVEGEEGLQKGFLFQREQQRFEAVLKILDRWATAFYKEEESSSSTVSSNPSREELETELQQWNKDLRTLRIVRFSETLDWKTQDSFLTIEKEILSRRDKVSQKLEELEAKTIKVSDDTALDKAPELESPREREWTFKFLSELVERAQEQKEELIDMAQEIEELEEEWEKTPAKEGTKLKTLEKKLSQKYQATLDFLASDKCPREKLERLPAFLRDKIERATILIAQPRQLFQELLDREKSIESLLHQPSLPSILKSTSSSELEPSQFLSTESSLQGELEEVPLAPSKTNLKTTTEISKNLFSFLEQGLQNRFATLGIHYTDEEAKDFSKIVIIQNHLSTSPEATENVEAYTEQLHTNEVLLESIHTRFMEKAHIAKKSEDLLVQSFKDDLYKIRGEVIEKQKSLSA